MPKAGMHHRKRRSRFRLRRNRPDSTQLSEARLMSPERESTMTFGTGTDFSYMETFGRGPDNEIDLAEEVCGATENTEDLLQDTGEEFRFADEPTDAEREDNSIEELGSVEPVDPDGLECVPEEEQRSGSVAVRNDVLKINNWRVLFGLILTTGSQKMTKFQYQAMRMVADAFHRLDRDVSRPWRITGADNTEVNLGKKVISCLPHYTTLTSKVKSALFNSLTVRSVVRNEPLDVSKAGARAKSYDSSTGAPQVPVCLVLPSEYARADLSTASVFNAMTSTALHTGSDTDGAQNSIKPTDCCDTIPIVVSRDWFYGPPRCFSVDSDGFAEAGDVVELCILEPADLCSGISESFKVGVTESMYANLRGEVTSVWTVQHSSRRETTEIDPSFSIGAVQRDRMLAERFSFRDYQSPFDSVSVTIPAVPVEVGYEDESFCEEEDPRRRRKKRKLPPSIAEAVRQRKEAIRRRKQLIEQAWAEWSKPLLKPGDVAALMKPYEPDSLGARSTDADSRLVLVHRFWTESEERGRHVFWVPGDSEGFPSAMDSYSTNLFRELVSCKLFKAHAGPRGPEKYSAVSSMGRLQSGELYFIYRFLLYWDGFEVSKGKTASGDGLYMICLNLPCDARATSNAVRILSMSPPGVKSNSVFKYIQEDVFKGMTQGFVDVDSTGNRRRIYLDLFGFLGDTPALNESLDILGHTATACCHLCKFSRGSTGLCGSRYTGVAHHGMKTESARGFYQIQGVRDCGAKTESCRLLGLRQNEDADLPLHAMRRAMMNARPLIPKTEDGVPLLSGYMDPYKSCFVAPDHLLTGHLKDCINMAFKLLPSNLHRMSCEDFILGFLRDCHLPVQNRLFDKEKKILLSMSMTELYSLAIVAEHGFIKGCEAINSTPGNIPTPSDQCKEAIRLVGSAARIIALMWKFPRSGRDSLGTVQSFNQDNGRRWISGIQRAVLAHLAKLQDTCSIGDEDMLAIEDASTPRAARAELEKKRKMSLVARRSVDKPNIDRLLELVHTTLPMVGHVSLVGELALEKPHQSLKRAVSLSNNKDVQLQSMRSVIFNDWQGRLTMFVNDALAADEKAIMGCYRLLAGRECMPETRSQLSRCHVEQVKQAIGPPCCVPALLIAEGRSVISPRYTAVSGQECKFFLDGELKRTCGPLADVYGALRRTGLVDSSSSAAFSNSIRATGTSGVPLLSLTSGDFVEMIVYNPNDVAFHQPLVVHRNNTGHELQGTPEGPSIWSLVCFISKRASGGAEELWAALHPCCMITCTPLQADCCRYKTRYKIGSSLHFVEVSLLMRRAAALHDCPPGSCVPNRGKSEITHETNLEGTNNFYIRGRTEGYPPRQG